MLPSNKGCINLFDCREALKEFLFNTNSHWDFVLNAPVDLGREALHLNGKANDAPSDLNLETMLEFSSA
jgi:hypothetical protein